MSEERLAAIKTRWRWNSVDALPTGSQAKMDMRALYDEVKRARADLAAYARLAGGLEARLDAALAVVRAVATDDSLVSSVSIIDDPQCNDCQVNPEREPHRATCIVTQARTLMASAESEQEGGGDGGFD